MPNLGLPKTYDFFFFFGSDFIQYIKGRKGAAIYIDIGGCVQCTFTIRDIERVSEWRQTLLLSLVLSTYTTLFPIPNLRFSESFLCYVNTVLTY